ncbi:hypothetical protein J1N10_07530 [Carboxylicivirga sp. A043]|uniref:hypothetical protein n=1 Tax=Carboxylicivirga litoralis TaxID=2816963 RepID=UPI0021CB6721|nr:hypothetical protein [Carboxylicivirga sp. A043]MCU4155824.1 hypothetical protein [Carboxylicivirga sp. A043]
MFGEPGAIERSQFYEVFSGDEHDDVNELITQLEKELPNSLVNAYKGALYMKLSSFMPKAKLKIETFKKGHILLENEIKAQPENIEYRFLRLVIQEQSPPILKYKKDIKSDKRLIMDHYADLEPLVQKYVLNYANKSKQLNENEFK